MQNHLIFRIATGTDVEDVTQLYLVSRKEFTPFAPLVHSNSEVYLWIRDYLIPTNRVTVVEQSGEVIGMMALSSDETTGWIDHIYLHPNFVGHKIGAKLIERAKAELGSPIRLYTFQANLGAVRFYERQGFKVIKYGDGSGNEETCPDILYEWSV